MVDNANLGNKHHGPFAVFFGQFADTLFTNHVAWIIWVWFPEGHICDGMGFFINFVSKSEGLESFHGTGMHSVGIGEFKAVTTLFDHPSVDVGESGQLCCRDGTGRSAADNEYVHFCWDFGRAVNAGPLCGHSQRVLGLVTRNMKLHSKLSVVTPGKSLD